MKTAAISSFPASRFYLLLFYLYKYFIAVSTLKNFIELLFNMVNFKYLVNFKASRGARV